MNPWTKDPFWGVPRQALSYVGRCADRVRYVSIGGRYELNVDDIQQARVSIEGAGDLVSGAQRLRSWWDRTKKGRTR